MKMLGGYVLVTEVEKETTTSGGIILSDVSKIDKATQPGLVLCIADDVEETATLAVGDQVYLTWTESQPVNVDGKKAAIIHYKHIKAVL
ncbi:co-chaperone GroES [bacterium]|nr:co-chaperone GroES [bacterium]